MSREQVDLARQGLEALLMDASPEQFAGIEEAYNALGALVGLPPEELYERD